MSSFSTLVLISLLIGGVSADSNIAFVSTLTSESYTLAVKVLAFSLRELHPHIPYVVLITQDISNATVTELRNHNVDVRQTEKIDTPYISDHKATKYQYTKIRLWSLIAYKSLVHLDLDVLPLRPIDGLFNCGSFCAAIRHSDMLNSGVFVFKPSMEIYEEMKAKSQLHNYTSYDGGDQGFLNTFFDQMKRGPMFVENETSPICAANQRPLSATFNYDIGMYYLNGGRLLIDPAIIHYTMGPVKPWKWWTYPLFDLNDRWLDARVKMEQVYHEHNTDVGLQWMFVLATGFLIVVYQILHIYIRDRIQSSSISWAEINLTPPIFIGLSIVIAFHFVPEQTRPFPAWVHFFCIMELSMVFTGCVYASLRRGRRASLALIIKFICFSLLLLLLIPLILVMYTSFVCKALWVLSGVSLSLGVLSFLLSRILIGDGDSMIRKYELLANKM